MIIHRVAATNVGPFVGVPVTAGPLAPGINILAAPNETGKTTLLKAAGRALFDRHTCKADEIKNLRPAGTSLAPQVTVEFETRDGRFQIEKTFLQSPRSQLSEQVGAQWKLVADGDSADDRLNALLQTTKPGRGATDAAHWGMLGYLWMRQGESADWPQWHRDPAGSRVQGMLVKVEVDPLIETVRNRMWSVFTENFTPSTNQPKVGGSLLVAETELARVDGELAEIARTRAQIQADQDQYDRLVDQLPRLEEEYARCRLEADSLRAAAGQASILQSELERCRHVLDTARERLKTVQQDSDVLRDQGRREEELAGKLRAAGQQAERLAREATAARENTRAAEAAQEENAQALTAAQTELARLGQRLRRHRLSAEIARTEGALERGAVQAEALDRLLARRGELPTIPPAKQTRLEKLDESIWANRVRLDALGLTVELSPTVGSAPLTVRVDDESPTELPAVAAGETRALHAAQALTLELPGWGMVRLRSGAGEARALREVLANDEKTLRQELAAFGAGTLAEACDLAVQVRDLDREILTVRTALASATGHGDKAPETLRASLAADRRQWEHLGQELKLTPVEATATLADLEAIEQTVGVRCEDRRAAAKILERRTREAREAVGGAARAQENAERAVLLLQSEREGLQKTAFALQARYPDGVQGAYDRAAESVAEAKFALKMVEGKLPPEIDTLPERNRRAATAAEQVNVSLQTTRSALAELRGRLELQGSGGLHGRENALASRRDALRVQVTHARARSRAARLVHDLIERRKQAATRSVLAPLQERLGARFAEVSGERDRRIFLDESLTVRGLGRKDGELVSFNDLSQGAKEQLLLCLRLSIAEELVAGGAGPQSLILDDVLVNTDATRQGRILTLLADAAQRLQILICTCHPERYRGVGEVIILRRE